jgi:hypothetical protein
LLGLPGGLVLAVRDAARKPWGQRIRYGKALVCAEGGLAVANENNAYLVDHEATYHRFMLLVKWALIHLASLIAFLAIWFCTPAGFWSALIVGLIILGVGVFAMNHGLNHSSEVTK